MCTEQNSFSRHDASVPAQMNDLSWSYFLQDTWTICSKSQLSPDTWSMSPDEINFQETWFIWSNENNHKDRSIRTFYQRYIAHCYFTCYFCLYRLKYLVWNINPKPAVGGHYALPLYIFVDNFFIVERINLKFGVNSYLSFSDHMKFFRVRFGS